MVEIAFFIGGLSFLVLMISCVMVTIYYIKKKMLKKYIGDNYLEDEKYKKFEKRSKKWTIAIYISFAIVGLSVSITDGEKKKEMRIEAERQEEMRLEQEKIDKENKIIERVNNLAGDDKVFFEEKYNTYIAQMTEKEAREKALKDLDDKIKAQKEKQARLDKMYASFKNGWNTKTTDTDSDNTNFEKALELFSIYGYEIKEMEAATVDINSAMKKPWDYYGEIVNVKGIVYNIRARPPEDSVVKYIGKPCFDATLRCDNGIQLVIIIIGDASFYNNNSYASFKGFICGHAILVNTKFGGESRGLLFVGQP